MVRRFSIARNRLSKTGGMKYICNTAYVLDYICGLPYIYPQQRLETMNPENLLAGTASLFMALGDRTRLRLLNLMRDREICVSSFTGTLGHSQPLISRHLAYLRNSGIVEARRDGKWIHYRIATSLDDNTTRLLSELFKWMENQDGLRIDRENYQEAYPNHSTPNLFDAKPEERPKRKRSPKISKRPREVEADIETDIGSDYEPEIETYREPEPQYNSISHHNEIEDFLL
jgi:ArsR family transcriptional regulator, arsenate/arsenite/antimonite-responsive transcriptional repressor